MKSIAIILAGGKGKRIRHLLPDLPKPLAPVLGKPFLWWILRYLVRQHNLSGIIISTGYLADKVKQFAKTVNFFQLEISCAKESFPLGTAGGVLNALDSNNFATDSVLVLNGDSLVLTDIAPMFQLLSEEFVDAVILGVEVNEAGRFGTLITDENELLVGFKEKQPGCGLINAGIYLFKQDMLSNLPRNIPLSFEMDVFPKMLADGKKIKVYKVVAPFIDIGTEESLYSAEEFIKSNNFYFN